MFDFLQNLFDSNQKQLNKAEPILEKINQLEEKYKKKTDQELLDESKKFRELIHPIPKDDEKEKEKLEEILIPSFALVREASRRVANHRHYDVQILAGYFLFENNIIELFTGEGKTLAANLPLYLYGITGKGAHLVTVNDYLAKRDAEWNGHILNSLGLTVGAINNDTQYKFITDEEALKIKGESAKAIIEKRDKLVKRIGRMKYDHMLGVNLVECSKKEAYSCDVVYGTNNEFGFDYLRDNMVKSLEDRVQGERHFAIVDEADSILIDEARTPLIISHSAENSNEMYIQFASIARQLEPETDYTVDEKSKSVVLTEEGMDHAEEILNKKDLYSDPTFSYHLENALKAKELFEKDDEYIIREGEVLIVDEFTGRVMQGRRYSEGLHQAIEAKEGVPVKKESKTIATITLQNYFRLYDFTAGMTATAVTEAEEFSSIYGLEVVVIPTNDPVIRKDYPDVVYNTANAKYNAIVEDIKEHYEKKQPVLVGTTSVEKSEYLSKLLRKEKVPHEVLNAKHHEREAKIVSDAGQKGSVTIATNMAGRGTDIALGDGVKELGGLYVIGTERHESRRIDNQLRGRSGRQGDPGESKFFISFEDDLMRIFGGEKMKMIMSQVGMDDDTPIASGLLGRTIESAQKKVESYHYDIRKRLVEYDDVLNQQREIVYGLRKKILEIIENNDADEGLKELDIEELKNIDVDEMLERIASFDIHNSNSYDLKNWENIDSVISIFILSKLINYIRNLVISQLEDGVIDNLEINELVDQIEALLGRGLVERATTLFGYDDALTYFKKLDKLEKVVDKEELIYKLVITGFFLHIKDLGGEAVNYLAKRLVLQSIDQFWMEHLDTMADLREGIGLRNMANRDPLIEYKNEGFRLFEDMLSEIEGNIVKSFFKIRVVEKLPDRNVVDVISDAVEVKQDAQSAFEGEKKQSEDSGHQTVVKKIDVGRNDPCPCGSGKKYKKCCYPKYE